MQPYSMFGITRCGKKHNENQDCILNREIETEEGGKIYLLGVADGISGSPYGGSVARWLMERQLSQMPLFASSVPDFGNPLAQALHNLTEAFHAEFADNQSMRSSGAAFAVAAVYADIAECFWAGDVAIYLNSKKKKYAGKPISEPDLNRFRELTNYFGKQPLDLHHATVSLGRGDVLTLASDGANTDQYVLQHYFQKHGPTQASLTMIAELALRSPRADDVSLCAVVHE